MVCVEWYSSAIFLCTRQKWCALEISSTLVMDELLAAIAPVDVVQKFPEILGCLNLGPISMAVVKTPSGAVVVLW